MRAWRQTNQPGLKSKAYDTPSDLLLFHTSEDIIHDMINKDVYDAIVPLPTTIVSIKLNVRG